MITGKIESPTASAHTALQLAMKATTTIDTTLLCGVLDFGGKKYYLDLNDFNAFVLAGKKFNFTNDTDVYPSYLYNYKRFSLLEHIFTYNSGNINYVFKNNNLHDLRRSNVEIYHKYHAIVKENYNLIEYVQGHYHTIGSDAFVLKNPMWKIMTSKNEEQLLMYCEKDTLCLLSAESYQKIVDYEKNNNDGKKITFYMLQNGYIGCSINLYIHQIITNCFGNGKGTKNVSVDHIDRNPLNNTMENLRVATREEQEQNTKGIMADTKRARKHNAKPLPEGITHEMMKKYVVYYDEYADKEKKRTREFFKVEKHPKLEQIWVGTKSNKVSILEKLRMANKVVSDLEHDIYPGNNDTGKLPTHITIKNERDKFQMIFDKKDNEKRFNLRMVLPENYNLEEQLGIFREKIKTKYAIEI